MEKWELLHVDSGNDDLTYLDLSNEKIPSLPAKSLKLSYIWDDTEDDDDRLHGGTIEWKIPSEDIRKARLSLTVDNTEQEIFVEEVREKENTLLDKDCCAEDVIKVWNHISRFIIRKLKEGRGVQIPGLCTITYQVEKFDVPDCQDYFELFKTPLMIVSPQVVNMYKLLNEQIDYNGQAKSVPLNLTEIARTSGLPRRIVEGVLTELLQAFIRAVVCDKKVEFPFPFIGKLQVQDRRAVMKFYEEFYSKMGYNLPLKFLSPLNSAGTDENSSEETEIDYNQTISGHMTPLRKHIPSDKFRSVFHLGEVRSVHDGELLANPIDIGEGTKGRCHDRVRKDSIKSNHPEDNADTDISKAEHRNRRQSHISALGVPEESLNGEEDEYHWNSHRKYWQDSCGQPLTYVVEPLYKIYETGKITIDAMNTSESTFMDALYTHHHNFCCTVLGMETVKKHYARRTNMSISPLSYENMQYDPPSP